MALFYKFMLEVYKIAGSSVSGPVVPSCIKICVAIAVFVAMHVCWRIHLQKHSSHMRAISASCNEVAIFEGNRGKSGDAILLGKTSVRGVLLIWIIV